MKSLEQLHEICERMRKVVQLREENAKEILEKAAMCESGKDADGNTYRTHVLVCGGTGCTSSGSARIRERLEKEIEANGSTLQSVANAETASSFSADRMF